MKFSTQEDMTRPIDAPMYDLIRDMLCEFDQFRTCRPGRPRCRRSQRVDHWQNGGGGCLWEAAFDMRGQAPRAQVEMDWFSNARQR